MSAQVLGFLRHCSPFPAAAPRGPAPGGGGAGSGGASGPAWGGEHKAHSQPREACLGSCDKELKTGLAAEGSAPPAPRTPWQMEAGVAAMDTVRGPQDPIPDPFRALVLLNPRSGKGKAQQLFWSHVQPLLVQANVSFRLMLTERRNHARELVRTEDLSLWDVLVVMSGDGLMHEVVNGLMERPDWQTAIRKPLCSLPAGSANALAASVNYYSGHEQVMNEELLTNCTLLLCHRLLSPMNLLSLHTASGLHLFSVLSLAWGFVADVDLESEKYRSLGTIRFTVGTFLRLASLRIYQGRLAYLPARGAISGMPTSPGPDTRGLASTFLAPLDKPVPAHWTVVPEQEFVLVVVLLHSHLGSDMFAAPMGRCDTGVMHLFYVRAGVSRAALLRLFLAMEKGRHMEYNCPYLVYVPVVAFRLEPQAGVFTVDGELMASEAIQGQIHPYSYWLVSGCSQSLSSQAPLPVPPPQRPS
ncbi:PREDICTED: sphingosine kinase 1 [Elephantulus edwardii]|uniref:sphingosine kinase 1 n=1 Tax=Elephantulus edwardii TaxID=28737 RepID=UPI0003F08DAD|nr:PREDICTED: sphingosine kinase 1 [Elephantulus edwardii]